MKKEAQAAQRVTERATALMTNAVHEAHDDVEAYCALRAATIGLLVAMHRGDYATVEGFLRDQLEQDISYMHDGVFDTEVVRHN